MDTQRFSLSSEEQNSMLFIDAINDAMSIFGQVDWDTVRIISKDKPNEGDAVYEYSEELTARTFRIHFQWSRTNQNIIQYDLYTKDSRNNWVKIGVDLKTIH